MSDLFSGFNRSQLEIAPLSTRRHNLKLSDVSELERSSFTRGSLQTVASKIIAAKNRDV